MIIHRFILAAALVLAASTTQAQDIVPVATYPADAAARNVPGWSVFTRQTAAGKECWAQAVPTTAVTDPPGRARDPIVFTVLVLPQPDRHQQPSVDVGYPLGDAVTARVDDGETFTLVTEAMLTNAVATDLEKAWLRTNEEDIRLVAAMRGGRELVVRGRSTRGTATTDTYSLIGISAAIDRALQECR